MFFAEMLACHMSEQVIHNTTKWISYASWTWEIVRRHPDYHEYYNSLKNKGLSQEIIANDLSLTTAIRHYPTAKIFGLLFPADPEFDAGDTPVFWHPDVFSSAVQFHVVPGDEIDRKDKPIRLSEFPGLQTHMIDADGTYHIRFLGEQFWFQLYCYELKNIAPDAYIGFSISRITNWEKKLKTIREMTGIYNGDIAIDSGLHVPARLVSHQKSLIAHDVRASGGSALDVILAFKHHGLIKEDPDNFRDFTDDVKNALRRAKSFIYGDFLQILDRQ